MHSDDFQRFQEFGHEFAHTVSSQVFGVQENFHPNRILDFLTFAVSIELLAILCRTDSPLRVFGAYPCGQKSSRQRALLLVQAVAPLQRDCCSRNSGVPTIVEIEWCVACRARSRVIVREFRRIQQLIPVSHVWVNVIAQDFFELAIDALGLAISLWMESCAHGLGHRPKLA